MENTEVIGDNKHGFIKGKSCLKNLVVVFHGARAFAGGTGADIIYLHLSKVFNTIPHYILVTKLEKYGFYE